MTDSPVNLSRQGPPETVLDAEAPDVIDALAHARSLPEGERRAAAAAVVAANPRCLDGWALIGDNARDDIEAYAAYRVGYHRGLDRLRQNGWRGSGFVRWEYPENRGFLRALAGLSRVAGLIGERDEEERCHHFLHQCDPSWPPAELAAH